MSGIVTFFVVVCSLQLQPVGLLLFFLGETRYGSYQICSMKVLYFLFFLSLLVTCIILSFLSDTQLSLLQVLFQNDSPATLLARVIGIIGSIDQSMLAKGRDTYKYFTKNHMLYERNQVTILFPSFLVYVKQTDEQSEILLFKMV